MYHSFKGVSTAEISSASTVKSVVWAKPSSYSRSHNNVVFCEHWDVIPARCHWNSRAWPVLPLPPFAVAVVFVWCSGELAHGKISLFCGIWYLLSSWKARRAPVLQQGKRWCWRRWPVGSSLLLGCSWLVGWREADTWTQTSHLFPWRFLKSPASAHCPAPFLTWFRICLLGAQGQGIS